MLVKHRNPTYYRDIAKSLRQLAKKMRFDLCRQAQLLALAAGFDRLAVRVERELVKAEAAD